MFYPATIEIENGTIKSIQPYNSDKIDKDYEDKWILPGFIDVHCHGGYGFDTNDGDREGLISWGKNILKEGITSFLPTTVTQDKETLSRAIKNVVDVKEEKVSDMAHIIGIHFEGPFLNMDNKGAQNGKFILDGDVEEFKFYEEVSRNNIKYVTMAIEHDKDFELTRYLDSKGIVCSVGHSGASLEQVMLGFANGTRSVTHTYNGMYPFHHRNNGVVGAALRNKALFSEIIGDGLHSTLEALNIFYNSKSKDSAILVTDSLMAKGLEEGIVYDFGGQRISLKGGVAYIEGTDTIAGSALRMNDGLRRLIEEAGVPVINAINSCTKNPATCLRIENKKGTIKSGLDADLVILDKNYDVVDYYLSR